MSLAAKFVRLLAALSVVLSLGASGSARVAAVPRAYSALDPVLQQRASTRAGHSRVIIRAADAVTPAALSAVLQKHGGVPGRPLPIINGYVATVPNAALAALAASPAIVHVSVDRPVTGAMERTAATIGSAAVRQTLGFDGAGIGVAVIDSGITSWHDDLTGAAGSAQRVVRFVDFINGQQTPYDDQGHGTHVAGIVAGNGFDSNGARAGIAPAARLIALKVLDSTGKGFVSDVIAALGYVVAHQGELNIRVANLSLSAAALEPYDADPLTLAAQQAVAKGIVVVAAAGNAGRDAEGAPQYGGVLAPGNAPWVITVGASSHAGTVHRGDDSLADFSSRGPAAGGYVAKPDLVAPGVGIESLSDPASAFYTTRAPYLLSGTVPTSYLPYLSMSGTSMSTPVVSGTVALMLNANPSLTPNQVKAILQYTAQVHPAYGPLAQGAGFLNAKGAVELARYLNAPRQQPYPSSVGWSRQLIWGNHLVKGGQLGLNSNAWPKSVIWGADTAPNGDVIEWGEAWEVAENVVWGSLCGGDDCESRWTTSAAPGVEDNAVVWGVNQGDAVVWGVNDGDAVVWGMECSDPSCVPVIWSNE